MHARVHSHVLQNHKAQKPEKQMKKEQRVKENRALYSVLTVFKPTQNSKKKKKLKIITANLTIGRGPIGLDKLRKLKNVNNHYN